MGWGGPEGFFRGAHGLEVFHAPRGVDRGGAECGAGVLVRSWIGHWGSLRVVEMVGRRGHGAPGGGAGAYTVALNRSPRCLSH